MRVVIDTNTLVSAIGWDGNERELIRRAMNGDFTLIVSDEILNEFLEVIHRPKFSFLDETKIKRFVILLLEFCEVPDVKTRVKVIVEDPDDDMVLACAKESNADVIVSGDSHLLKLGIWSKIRILKTLELLKKLR